LFPALALILITWITTLLHSTETSAVVRQTQTASTLCLLGVTGLPVAVRFRDSITFTQALEQAGIRRESIKNEIVIMRRLETKMIQPTKIDLKAIDKGTRADFRLDQHDLIFVVARKKQPLAKWENIWAACAVCGCQTLAGMHGPFIVPKEWDASADPQKTDPDH
jgi:hypothetical protein